MCAQYTTVFISYNGDKRYDFPITPERLAKSPPWLEEQPNRPLPARRVSGDAFSRCRAMEACVQIGSRAPGCSGRCAAPGCAVIEFLESCGPTFALTLPGCRDLLVVIAVAFAVAGLKRLRAALDDDAESPHFIENRAPARVSLPRGSQWRTRKWSRADCAGGSEAGCRRQACPSLKKWDCSSCCSSCAQDEQ